MTISTGHKPGFKVIWLRTVRLSLSFYWWLHTQHVYL